MYSFLGVVVQLWAAVAERDGGWGATDFSLSLSLLPTFLLLSCGGGKGKEKGGGGGTAKKLDLEKRFRPLSATPVRAIANGGREKLKEHHLHIDGLLKKTRDQAHTDWCLFSGLRQGQFLACFYGETFLRKSKANKKSPCDVFLLNILIHKTICI